MDMIGGEIFLEGEIKSCLVCLVSFGTGIGGVDSVRECQIPIMPSLFYF